jgi:cytochrome b561
VPLVGWLGISAFDARGLFGIVSVPALVSKGALDPVTVFNVHKALAILTVALVAVHVGAAVVLHYFIRGDGVLARMLPAVGIRGRR